jgi:hypothetical protein
MNANIDLDRRLADFYASEAPQRAPDRVLHGALAAIDSTQQRRVLIPAPWRFPNMNSYAKVAFAAIAVIAFGAVGLAIWRGGLAPSPGVATPSASPVSGPSDSPPAGLSQRFDSVIHGISVSYPASWTAQPATVPWTSGLPGDTDGARDTIEDGAGSSSFIGLASQPLGGKTGEQWATDLLADPDGFCHPPTEEISVGGFPGVLAQCSDGNTNGLLALAWTEDRGYWIVSYRLNDRAFFDQVLSTVALRPGEAASTISGTALGRAGNFVPPFRYTVPSRPRFGKGAETDSYFEVRSADLYSAGHPAGLIVQAVAAGRRDPCFLDSVAAPLDSGPEKVMDYLSKIPQLTVQEPEATTVDGRPALQARVTAKPGTADCPELHVWREEGEPFITEQDLRLIATHVDGKPIVITIFGEPDNPGWPALADQIVASIDFQSAP